MHFNILGRKIMDYYYVLGILPTATREEVKAAYRKMATRYHPDKNVGKPDAELKMREVNDAYEVLSDPEQRQSYDQAQSSQILSDPVATATEIWAIFLGPCVR